MTDTITLTANMPVMIPPQVQIERIARGKPFVKVESIPRSMFTTNSEEYAQINHGQTLERLRERGGLDAKEALAILSSCKYDVIETLDIFTAHRILYHMIALHHRGMRVAEQRAGLPNLSTHRESE